MHSVRERHHFFGSSLASGPQDGLGQGGLRLKWAKGRFGPKNNERITVLRMGLPIVESLSGLQESIFSLFRGPQLNSREKSKTCQNEILHGEKAYTPVADLRRVFLAYLEAPRFNSR